MVSTGPHEQPLKFEVDVTAGTATVVLSGDLDLGNHNSLAHHLARVLEHEPRRLIFEMAQVSFVDCASARLIAGTGRSLPEGVRPVIRGARPIVCTVLRITGLDALCDLAG
jgi:anti-anti-sigma factor